MDRIKDEILDSMCFQRCKKERKDFIQFAIDKITFISGDLTRENLGISEKDRTFLTENCDVIINSAASVNFDDPLQDALKINFFGCMRMLQLAKECKHLLTFTHVSTCYVNCDRDDFCGETIYTTSDDECDDIHNYVKNIMAMNPAEVKAK